MNWIVLQVVNIQRKLMSVTIDTSRLQLTRILVSVVRLPRRQCHPTSTDSACQSSALSTPLSLPTYPDPRRRVDVEAVGQVDHVFRRDMSNDA